MKIGIWLGSESAKTLGGGSSYRSRFLTLIDNYNFSEGIEVCYLSIVPQPNLKGELINISQIPKSLYKILKFSKFLTKYLRIIDKIIIYLKGLKSVLKGSNVKVVFFTTQCAYFDTDFPFISNNWDIGHRSTHSFPEVVNHGEFESRDHYYKNILPKSLLVICESETGKKELMDYTGLGSHKIRVMPIFAGIVSTLNVPDKEMNQILQENGLKKNYYFYYPAQFWPHKNHIGLLKAFKEFSNNQKGYKLVLSGSDHGNKDYIEKRVEEYGLSNDVLFMGFVSDETVYTLYKNATCLVMASHFGPTNMPPIEAMELGCPVVCSDLGGHKEILGENALYFNSYDSHSIYLTLKEVSNNRQTYVDKIQEQQRLTSFSANNAMKRLDDIFKEVVVIRDNWE